MDDGIDLAATLYVPDAPGDGPFPAVLESIPYRKDDWTLSRDWPLHGAFAAAGYVSCRLDVRGTGSSRGIAEDEYTEREILDNLAVIDWLAIAALERRDGRHVRDQLGRLLGAAGRDAPAAGPEGDHPGLLQPRPLPRRRPLVGRHPPHRGERLLAGRDGRRERPAARPRALRAGLARGVAAAPRRRRPQWPFSSLRHQRRDDHWRHGSAIEDWGSIEAAVLALGGLGGLVPRQRPRGRGQRPGARPAGSWARGATPGRTPAPRAPTIDGVGLMTRWWDRWLKGERNGIDEGPALTLFAVEPEAGRAVPRRVSPRRVRRAAGGRSAAGRPVPPDRPAAARSTSAGDGAAGPRDARPRAAPARRGARHVDRRPRVGADGAVHLHRLASRRAGRWTSARTTPARSSTRARRSREPVLVAGFPVVDLWLAADRPVAQVAVRLEAVAPDGTSALLARGLLNLTRRDSFEEPAPVVPGEVMAVTRAAHRDRCPRPGRPSPAGRRRRGRVPGRLAAAGAGGAHASSTTPSGRRALRLPTPAGWAPATEDLGTGAFDPGTAEELARHPGGVAGRARRARPARRRSSRRLGGGHRFPERGGLVFGSDERFRITAARRLGDRVGRGSDRLPRRLLRRAGRSPPTGASSSARPRPTSRSGSTCTVSEDGAEVFERTWEERIPRDLV